MKKKRKLLKRANKRVQKKDTHKPKASQAIESTSPEGFSGSETNPDLVLEQYLELYDKNLKEGKADFAGLAEAFQKHNNSKKKSTKNLDTNKKPVQLTKRTLKVLGKSNNKVFKKQSVKTMETPIMAKPTSESKLPDINTNPEVFFEKYVKIIQDGITEQTETLVAEGEKPKTIKPKKVVSHYEENIHYIFDAAEEAVNELDEFLSPEQKKKRRLAQFKGNKNITLSIIGFATGIGAFFGLLERNILPFAIGGFLIGIVSKVMHDVSSLKSDKTYRKEKAKDLTDHYRGGLYSCGLFDQYFWDYKSNANDKEKEMFENAREILLDGVKEGTLTKERLSELREEYGAKKTKLAPTG